MTRFPRKTLAGQAVFKGLGLHSGAPVTATVHPGESGIAFVVGGTRTLALPENVTDTKNCTRLGEVSTIEHLMAAFACLGVTDADVVVQGGELPAMDGAALEYCEAMVGVGFSSVGFMQVDGPFSRVYHHDGDIKIAIGHGEGHWRYEFECGDRWPGSQHFDALLNVEVFMAQIAPARTFAFEENLKELREAGLGRGLDETTAFVIGESGYVNATKFPDEPARHKLLDLIGDLWLAGVPFSCLNVVASRSGHRTNLAAARKLRAAVKFTD